MDKKLEIILATKEMGEKAWGNVNKRITTLQKHVFSLKGAFAGLVGAYGIKELVDYTTDTLKQADAIAKTADKLGLSTDALQEYRFAASQASIKTEVMDMAMQRFIRRTAEAAQGKGELVATLKQYNIQVTDSFGKTRKSEEVLEDLADVIAGIPDEAERLRIAFKAFDSEGAIMVNMLRDGSRGLERYRKEARELGIVLDEDILRRAEQTVNEIDKLKRAASALGSTIVLEVAPHITELAKQTNEWFKANNKLIKLKIPEYVEETGEALKKIWDLIHDNKDILEYGLIGLAVMGRKGLIAGGALGWMAEEVKKWGKLTAMLTTGALKLTKEELNDLLFTWGGLDAAIAKGEGRLKQIETGGAKLSIRELIDEIERLKKAQQELVASRKKEAIETGIWPDIEAEYNARNAQIRTYKKLVKDMQDEALKATAGAFVLDIRGKVKTEAPGGEIKTITEEQKAAVTAFSREMISEVHKGGDEIIAMQAQLTDRIKELSLDAFEYRRWVLDRDTQALVDKYGNDRETLQLITEAWLAESDKIAEDQKTFYAELNKLSEESGNRMMEFSRRTSEAMEQNFSDFYFDVMTRKFKKLKDYANAVFNSIIRAAADMMGQWTAEKIFGKTGTGGWFGSLVNKIGSAFGFAEGGLIKEHVVGLGTRSGRRYDIGEAGEPELITPLRRINQQPTMVKFRAEVINKTGVDFQGEEGDIFFDGEEYVSQIVLQKRITSRNFRHQMRKM